MTTFGPPRVARFVLGLVRWLAPHPAPRIKPPETSVLPEDIGEVIFNASRRDEGTISALGAITLAKALLAHFKIENLPRG